MLIWGPLNGNLGTFFPSSYFVVVYITKGTNITFFKFILFILITIGTKSHFIYLRLLFLQQEQKSHFIYLRFDISCSMMKTEFNKPQLKKISMQFWHQVHLIGNRRSLTEHCMCEHGFKRGAEPSVQGFKGSGDPIRWENCVLKS